MVEIRSWFYERYIYHSPVIFLAAISLPFILLTRLRFTNQFEKHRQFAKSFPIWLYVAITGPIVYIVLQPCY